MNRLQTFHETLIPMLVSACGAQSYLEFGTHTNETIGRVVCGRRYGVDINPIRCHGVTMFQMTTREFIRNHASLNAPYDFVLIDADHTADAVEDDYNGILPHVSPEGLICLHDTNPQTELDTQFGLCGNAWEFARDLHDRGAEALTLPYHPGLTIIRKRIQWGPAS